MTGIIAGALKGAFFGGRSVGLAYGIGHVLSIPEGSVGKMIAHGAAQGGVSRLQGGKFSSGFVGGFFGHMTGGFVKGIGKHLGSVGVAMRTTAAAVVGGTISKLTGGKFANGARTAAFVHLFNAESGGTPKPKARNELLSVFTFDEAFGGHAAFAFTHNGSSVLVDPNGSFVPIGANERAGFIFDVDVTEYLGHWNVTDNVGVFMQSIPISSNESAALNAATINPEAYLFGSICYCASTTGNFISSNIPRFGSLRQPTLPTTIRDYFSSQGYRAVRYAD